MAIVLITGANGFIGSHLVQKFLREGHQVKAFVRKSSDVSFLNGMNPTIVYGDILDKKSLMSAMLEVDIVIHNAGFASDWGAYQDFYQINVEGTQNVAMAAAERKVKRLVYMSSVAVHGFGSETMMEETSPFRYTFFPYTKSKWIAEQWIMEYTKLVDMEVTAVRPGNVFGTRDHTFMSKYLDALERGQTAVINRGSSKTCPTYVENLAHGVYLAAMHPQAPGQSFIITDGLDIDWKTFNKKLTDALNLKESTASFPFGLAYFAGSILEFSYKLFGSKKSPLITRYRVLNGGKNYWFSIEKAKNILGYKPIIDLDTAVRKTIEWYRANKKK